MTGLQKAWVRTFGVVIGAIAIGALAFYQFRSDPVSGPMQGKSADLFCSNFAKTLQREHASGQVDYDLPDIERLWDGFSARIQNAPSADLTDAERDALYSGRLKTMALLGQIERNLDASAKTTLDQMFSQCEARLEKLRIPPLPEEPEEASTEWYLRNR